MCGESGVTVSYRVVKINLAMSFKHRRSRHPTCKCGPGLNVMEFLPGNSFCFRYIDCFYCINDKISHDVSVSIAIATLQDA